jgi:hypothetical protein
VRRFFEQRWTVFEQPEPAITANTQNAAGFSCIVIVVHVPIPSAGFSNATHSAPPALRNQNRLKLFWHYSVSAHTVVGRVKRVF